MDLKCEILRLRRRVRVWCLRQVGDERGATTLEWALLLAAVAIPSLIILMIAMGALTSHYKMMTLLNSLPFP